MTHCILVPVHEFLLSVQVTPPYSLFKKSLISLQIKKKKLRILPKNFKNHKARQIHQQRHKSILKYKNSQIQKFKWMEYHKWKFGAEWYFNIVDKLVLMTNIRWDSLLRTITKSNSTGLSALELGGDGINNQNSGLQGKRNHYVERL